MSLAAVAVGKRTITYFATFLVVIAGLASFFSLGQLEDPEFTVKIATVVTRYPGASAEEVELEVTDRLEIALQELSQIDYLASWSRPGESLIEINIKQEYWSDRLPQVWDEMRRIPYGHVRTYGQIAEAIGAETAQPVGAACGANPIPIIIPCHRVVAAGG